ncbi:dTMP kinase [Streptomyces sp. R44]|uniref:Thymidylate kinase n=1 Tax=Streptomyces sp. R44 TaxID=3238633 RepID=A0AB39TAF4_9ACTN
MPHRITFEPRTDTGRLIVLCGTDGVGKTSLMSALHTEGNARGWRVNQLKQPTPELRQDAYFRRMSSTMETDPTAARAAVMMAMADRLVSCRETVVPLLEAGETVIIDRYVFSGLARLGLWDPADDHSWFVEACRGLPRPDLTVLLVADEDVIGRRLAERDYETTSEAAFRTVLAVQRALLGLAEDNDMTVVDTSATTVAASTARVIDHFDLHEIRA